MSVAPELLAPAPTRPRSRGRHLRVVDAPRRLRLHAPRALVVLAGLLLVGGMFAVAICHAILAQGQLRLDALERDVADAQAQYERNRLEIARLESPARIVAEARDRLGMVPAEEVVYLTPEEPLDVPVDELPTGAQAAAPAGDAVHDWEAVKPYLESSP